MNERQKAIAQPAVTLGSIYYALFRHKWKIISCFAAGVLAAVALPLMMPPSYQSEAKLLIRYVMDNKSLIAAGTDSKIKTPDERGDNIINSEIEILTSLDLAQQVADTVGAEKILAKAGGGNDRNRAASLVRKNLIVEVPRKSNVIRVAYQHPDATIVQPVLREVVDRYFKKHAEIHRAVGVFDDFLTQETDQLRSRLAATEEDLRKVKIKAGVTSLEDTKKAYTEQISKIRQELISAGAELAEHQAALKASPNPESAASLTTPAEPDIPSGKIEEYRNLCARLDLLWKREQELLTQFTQESQRVKDVHEQIVVAEQLKKKFEAEHPRLVNLAAAAPKPTGKQSSQDTGLADDLARVPALESRIKFLNSQLDQIRAQAASIDSMEASIVELQRKKDLDESNYKYFSASLEQSRIDEALGANRASNISQIQAPSPPFRDSSQIPKIRSIAIAGGLLIGLAWAFVFEFYFDRSVKRPGEIEAKLRLPLFLSLPDVRRNGYHKNGNGALPASTYGGMNVESGATQPAPWMPHPSLRPFLEALGGRLIMYFEAKRITHRPKLVAVTAPGKGLGTTTIATGMGACLSETGGGKVLMVDMTPEHGTMKRFYKGEYECGPDVALETGTSDNALVQNNLYVVDGTSNGDGRPKILPKQFIDLVARLRTSDYDYVIFDMPPISQISATSHLAGYMDLVLLVVESEKTGRDVALQASAMLAESKANVCVVLNKTRSYGPPLMRQEYLSEI